MAVSDADVKAWLEANPNASDAQIAQAAKDAGVSTGQLSRVTQVPEAEVITRASTAGVPLTSNSVPVTGGTGGGPSITSGTSGITTGSGASPGTTLDLSQSANGITLGGGGTNIDLTQPSESTVIGTNTGYTPGVTVDPSTITPAPAPPPPAETGGTGGGTNFVPTDVSKNPYAEFLENRALSTTLPEGTEYTPTDLAVGSQEIVSGPTALSTSGTTTVDQASTAGLEVATPEAMGAPVVVTDEILPDLGNMDEILGQLSPESLIDAPQGTVGSQSLAQAATADLDEKATVQYQLAEITASLEDGKPLPAWASPTARKVNALMQQRGLGASSMASAAMTQALLESGVQIAATDAEKYATIQLANLNNRQQAALQNASVYAAMDTANLNARLTAAVNNAKSFLTMDMANLENSQKTATVNYNAELQALFTDVAAENATRQLNAKSQMQVDEFFTELAVQTETANVNRIASMNQFNVSQTNAMAQFDASLNDQREKFNSTMYAQIEQSNAAWRRQINTANTAEANEAARLNVQNLLQVNQTAQAQLWQKYRDEAAWAFQMSSNELNRAHEIGMLAMQSDINADLYDKQFKDKAGMALGESALGIIFG